MTEKTKTAMMNEIEWSIEYNKKALAETIKEAQDAARKFLDFDPTNSMADWRIDGLLDIIEKKRVQAKEYKAKIDALCQAAAIAKSYND